MQLVRERAVVVGDPWVHLGDEDALPDGGDVIVPYARWQREREALSAREGRLGVRVPSDTRAAELGEHAASFAVIAIELPKYTDGRGYTIARLLRDRYGYRGEVRAVGNVLRDQLQLLERCGFDAFEIDPSKDAGRVLSGFSDFSVKYQPAADETQPLWRRHARPWPADR
ncbi:MAG: DUF934 domain-containing protein [Myxococcota bacterium]|nr:DUF934 domain-containing protein [Myxococcota bacterium]